MTPPTTWTEPSQTPPGWVSGGTVTLDDCFCIFGDMAIPVSGSFVVKDINTSYIEVSQAATAYAEVSKAATSWTEVSP